MSNFVTLATDYHGFFQELFRFFGIFFITVIGLNTSYVIVGWVSRRFFGYEPSHAARCYLTSFLMLLIGLFLANMGFIVCAMVHSIVAYCCDDSERAFDRIDNATTR